MLLAGLYVGSEVALALKPGIFLSRAHTDVVFLAMNVSAQGVIAMMWAPSAFHTAGKTLTFIVNPWLMFFVAAFVVCIVDMSNQTVLLSSSTLIIVISSMFAWTGVSQMLLPLVIWSRQFAIFKNERVKKIVEQRLVVPSKLWRTSKVIATIAQEKTFIHPLERPNPGSDLYKERMGLNEPGAVFTEWVPKYVELENIPTEKQMSVLLTTSAIPIAFPMERDENGASMCDGGVVDNIPIIACSHMAKCDRIIVVMLNKEEKVGIKALQERIDSLWATSVLASMNAKQRKTLSDRAKAEKVDWMTLIPGRTLVDPSSVISIVPSKPLCTYNLPILSFLTGTLNFDPAALKNWAKLGYDDAMAVFGQPAT
jgi:hypothetical protein